MAHWQMTELQPEFQKYDKGEPIVRKANKQLEWLTDPRYPAKRNLIV